MPTNDLTQIGPIFAAIVRGAALQTLRFHTKRATAIADLDERHREVLLGFHALIAAARAGVFEEPVHHA